MSPLFWNTYIRNRALLLARYQRSWICHDVPSLKKRMRYWLYSSINQSNILFITLTGKFGHCATAEKDFGKEKSGDIYTQLKRGKRDGKNHT